MREIHIDSKSCQQVRFLHGKGLENPGYPLTA